MRFWKQKSSLVQISKKQLELETAKEILQEVFHACPSDVEDMIQQRLDELSHHRNEREGLWPATFSLR
jgi:hypothetical protein